MPPYTEFAKLFYEAFPSVSVTTGKNALNVLQRIGEHPSSFFAPGPFSLPLFQADIIGPFNHGLTVQESLEHEQEIAMITGFGMVMAVNCDIDNKPLVYFASAKLLDEFITERELNAQKIDDLKKNKITSYLYLPIPGKLWVVDLSFLFSVVGKLLVENIENKKISIEVRLTDQGHRFFQMKLAHHMFRPENPDDRPDFNRPKAPVLPLIANLTTGTIEIQPS